MCPQFQLFYQGLKIFSVLENSFLIIAKMNDQHQLTIHTVLIPSTLYMVLGVGGAVRFLVVGTISQGERPPRGQLWMEQCLTSLKYWPI